MNTNTHNTTHTHNAQSRSTRPTKRALALLVLSASLLGACAGPRQAPQPTERQAKAIAMWQERCKTAGEKIHKTVDNVEGIYLMKVRPEKPNFSDQFKLDDPYGRDLVGGYGYIESFVRGQYAATHVADQGQSTEKWPRGYAYVEAQDPKDGQRYRYTGGMKVVGQKDITAPGIQFELRRNPNYDINNYAFVLDKSPQKTPAPRYGVTYDDISTREEREYWIAGSSLKVIDLQTNEVIAERIGYMVDRGQGNTSGGRSPWLFAANNTCSNQFGNQQASSAQPYQATRFVEKVLKPIK